MIPSQEGRTTERAKRLDVLAPQCWKTKIYFLGAKFVASLSRFHEFSRESETALIEYADGQQLYKKKTVTGSVIAE